MWVIASAYMGILDTLGLVGQQTGSITVSRGLGTQLTILVVGLVISIVDVRRSANQNSQKTKILNIIDEEATPKTKENKRVLQHLFEDEELE